jgi:Skp family chaperone for outer membrane proteins
MATGVTLAAPQDPSGGVRAAVVNIPRASEEYRKTADLEAHFGELRDTFTKQRDAQREQIQRMTRSLQEELKPGSEDFRHRAKQVAMMEAELAWFNEAEGEHIEMGLRTSLLAIYEDIHSAVREVAAEKGLDLVLTADQLPQEQPSSAGQVRQQILLQKVLYWSPSLDITDEVVERLNLRYQQRAEAAAAAGGSNPTSTGGGSRQAPVPSDMQGVSPAP